MIRKWWNDIIPLPDTITSFDENWSPDGKTVVYIGTDYAIHTMQANGQADHAITAQYLAWRPPFLQPDGSKIQTGEYQFSYAEPAFSPNGELITFRRGESASTRQDIFAIFPWGGGLFNMTRNILPDKSVTLEPRGWSPDSSMMLVWAIGEKDKFYVVTLGKTSVIQLPNGYDDASWSGNGHFISLYSQLGKMYWTFDVDHPDAGVKSAQGRCSGATS